MQCYKLFPPSLSILQDHVVNLLRKVGGAEILSTNTKPATVFL